MPGKHLLSRLLAVLLLAGTAAIPAQQDLPCAPFRDGRVDPRLIAIMLAAAEHGHLYRVDPAPSRIGFCADSHFMHIEGYFREFQGGMALHPHEDAAEQMMVLVHTDSLATSPAFVENMLKDERFLIRPYTRTSCSPAPASTGSRPPWHGAPSQLTLHGVTRPVDFSVALAAPRDAAAGNSERTLLDASTTIRRSDFGMDALKLVVDDTVQLCLRIEAAQYCQPEHMPAADFDTGSGFNE